jgi:hypothetical protein
MSAEWDRAALRSVRSSRSGRSPLAVRAAFTAVRTPASLELAGPADADGAEARRRKHAAKRAKMWFPRGKRRVSQPGRTESVPHLGGSPTGRSAGKLLGGGAERVRELAPGRDLELAIDAREVGFHRLRRHEQQLDDVLVRHVFRRTATSVVARHGISQDELVRELRTILPAPPGEDGLTLLVALQYE